MKKPKLLFIILVVIIIFQSCDVDDIPITASPNFAKIDFLNYLYSSNPIYQYPFMIEISVKTGRNELIDLEIWAEFHKNNWDNLPLDIGNLYIDTLITNIAYPLISDSTNPIFDSTKAFYYYNNYYEKPEQVPLFGSEFKFGWSGNSSNSIPEWESNIKLQPLINIINLPKDKHFKISDGLTLIWNSDLNYSQNFPIVIEFRNIQWHSLLWDTGEFTIPPKVLNLMKENDSVNIRIGRNVQKVFSTQNGECAITTTEIFETVLIAN